MALKLCSEIDQTFCMSTKLFNIAKVITLSVICFLVSCKPDEATFDLIPQIELLSTSFIKDILGKDSIIRLEIGYQDGDGDIGLTESDTAPPFNFGNPFYHNLPVTYLVENSMGEYEELVDPNNSKPYGNQHERIPNLTPNGKYKAIQGTLYISLTADPALLKPEKLKLEINVIDRALNVSNTVITDIIELEH